IAVLRWPDQADGRGPNPHPAGETLKLLRLQWHRQNARLRGLRHGLLGRHIHVLSVTGALALVVRDEGGDGSLSTGMQVRLRDTHPHRCAVVIAREHERPTSRKDDEIALGVVRLRSILAKGGDRDIDQGRVESLQITIAEPIRCESPRRVRFDKKVRPGHQTMQYGLPVTAGDIERDAALVAVVGPPEQRAIRAGYVMIKGTEATRG